VAGCFLYDPVASGVPIFPAGREDQGKSHTRTSVPHPSKTGWRAPPFASRRHFPATTSTSNLINHVTFALASALPFCFRFRDEPPFLSSKLNNPSYSLWLHPLNELLEGKLKGRGTYSRILTPQPENYLWRPGKHTRRDIHNNFYLRLVELFNL